MTAILERLRCWWYGHEDVFTFEPRRLALHCLICGRDTTGWRLDLPRPVPIGRASA